MPLPNLAAYVGSRMAVSDHRSPESERLLHENTPESLFARTQNAASANDAAVARPTGTQKQSYEDAGKQLREELAKLRQIQDKDLPELEKKLDALGAPTASGKLPVWDGK